MSLAGRDILKELEDASARSFLRSSAIGAFICSAGIAVMAIAILEACEQWFPHAAPLYPIWAIVFLAVAAGSIFWGVNYFKPKGRISGPLSLQLVRTIIKYRPYATGVFALAVAALILATAVIDSHKCSISDHQCPEREYFAVIAPPQIQPQTEKQQTDTRQADAQPKAGILPISSPSEPQRNPSTAQNPQQPAATSAPATILAWSVDKERAPLPPGIPAIFLGGMFIAAFGIGFARMGDGADKGIVIGEKLLAPVLSLALIGFGASQRAEAAKEQNNLRLVEQNLPPIIRMSDGKVELPIHLYGPGELNSNTRILLDEKIEDARDSLMGQISNLSKTIDSGQRAESNVTWQALNTMQLQLWDLQKRLSQIPKTGDWATKENLQALSTRLTSIDALAKGGMDGLNRLQKNVDNDDQWQCTLWRKTSPELTKRRDALKAVIEEKLQKAAAYRSHGWVSRQFISTPLTPDQEQSELSMLSGLSESIGLAEERVCNRRTDDSGSTSK